MEPQNLKEVWVEGRRGRRDGVEGGAGRPGTLRLVVRDFSYWGLTLGTL